MSYIVQALRKLEQERRRVTVTEMTLFRGLSERWQSEKPVWRYMLVLSVVVNLGVAAWLAMMFFYGGAGRPSSRLNSHAMDTVKDTAAGPLSNSMVTDSPMKLSLDITPSARVRNQTYTRPEAPVYQSRSSSRKRTIARDNYHAPREIVTTEDIEMHAVSPSASPNVMIWKDDKGVIHYSGIAGRD